MYYNYLLGWQTHRNCTSRMSITWKLTASEHVNGMQEKAHAQAQGKHVESSAWHAHTKGPCKPQMTAKTLCVLQLQDKQKRNARATRCMACAPRGHFVEARGQKHLECRSRCHMSCSAVPGSCAMCRLAHCCDRE